MIPQILGHYHIMTNFDCPNNANGQAARWRPSIDVTVSVPCYQSLWTCALLVASWLASSRNYPGTSWLFKDGKGKGSRRSPEDRRFKGAEKNDEPDLIADPSKSPRRLSSAGLPPNPSFEKWSPYRQCKVQNDLLLINHKPNFFKPWFIQLTEICVVI